MHAKPKNQEKSRLEGLKESDSPLLQLPQIEAFYYLIEYLFEFGPTLSTGMGCIPVSFTEIKSWSEVTSIDLSPWEANALHKLSCDYLSEYNQSDDPERPAPYCKELTFDEQKVVSDKLNMWFKSFKSLKHSKKRKK